MVYLYALFSEFLLKYLPENLANFLAMVLFPILPFCLVAVVLILSVLFLVLFERKLLGVFTQRFGPNRVGYCGILQTVADAIKLLCKENITPYKADKVIFTLAPLVAFVPVMVVWGLIPFCSEFVFMDFSINILLFTSIVMFPVLGILLAGYASNNKYSLVGSVRSVIQAISYELPLVFVILSVVVLSSSLNLNQIVLAQSNNYPMFGWFMFPAFLGFIIMLICLISELNRCPFDLPEAESELSEGYNTEYSGMRFAFFFLGEYAMMFIMCAFIATLFLGGYLSPFGTYISPILIKSELWSNILVYFEQVIWLFAKIFLLLYLMIWVRATLPRFKAETLLKFSWKFLLPLSFLNLLIVCLIKSGGNYGG